VNPPWILADSFTVDGIVYRPGRTNHVVRPMIQLIKDGGVGVGVSYPARMCHTHPPSEAELDDFVRWDRLPRYPR
jgi:hypothetical protein